MPPLETSPPPPEILYVLLLLLLFLFKHKITPLNHHLI